MKKALTIFALAALTAGTLAPAASGQDLEELLVQVGQDYGEAYSSPFIHAFGPNQNANLYQSAQIPWAGLNFGVGVKVMGTQLNADDQTFQKVVRNVDLGAYDPAFAGQTGDVVMGGPTMFGDKNTNGVVRGYVGGIEVFEQEAIPGLIDSRWVPMATPEAYVGGLFGLRGVVRWFPDVNTDYGKTKYLGLGVQWSPNGLFPQFPLDVMVGYFDQGLDVGELVKSSAETLHLAVSYSLPALTFYGGYASEKSSMDVSYTYEATGDNVAFSVEGRQTDRFTLGATLDIVLKLNVEAGFGDLTTYSAGLMFGM